MNKSKTFSLRMLGLGLSLGFLPMTGFAAEASGTSSSPHSFTGNVTLTSEYLYRGISQTNGKPAVQGGFDYSHTSGLYAGVWASSISWLADAGPGISAPLEVDVYAGYKGSLGGDTSYDAGVLTYNYPGTYPAGFVSADTTEVYGALGWKFLTLKYSHVVSSHIFGATTLSGGKTNGSGYLDLSASYELGDGWGVNAHVGHQKVRDRSDASYSDYRVGVSKDLGFGSLGLSYLATNAQGDAGQFYRNAYGRDLGDARFILSFGKTF